MSNIYKLVFLSLLITTSFSYAHENICDTKELREQVLTKIGYAPTRFSFNNLSLHCKYEDWIQAQLDNPHLYSDIKIQNKLADFKSHKYNNLEITHLYNEDDDNVGTTLRKEAEATRINYALYSENRLREMMVWFWFNHFNIYGNDGTVIYFKSYEDIFRHNPFGNFKDILRQVTTHPSMLTYLDNDLNNKEMIFKSKKIGMNDNHAREIFELHTMGVNGGYTEQDIQEMAKILSGFKSIDKYNQIYEGDDESLKNEYHPNILKINNIKDFIDFTKKNKKSNIDYINNNFGIFSQKFHDNSDKKILNKTIHGKDHTELNQALDVIISHPSTAEFLSKKIAVFFLGNEPKEDLLNNMKKAFIKTNGNIKSVLEVLLFSSDFKSNLNKYASFKNPYEFYISTSKLTLDENNIDVSEKIAGYLHNSGFGIYSKITPEGYSIVPNSFLSSNTLSNYINFIYLLKDNSKEALNIKEFNNYYKMNQNDYIKFLISDKWIYR